MKKYNTGDQNYDLTNFLADTNDIAWKIIDREDIGYNYPVEPIYPLNWFICYGKAPAEFINNLLDSKPSNIARILVDRMDDDSMDIVRIIENVIDSHAKLKKG